MVLEKCKELYESGILISEEFQNHQFIVELSHNKVSLRNSHYLTNETAVSITPDFFNTVLEHIGSWEKKKDALWGRRAHGHSWCGYIGSTYFEPNNDEGTYVKKGEPKPSIGTLEEKLDIFTFERFRFGIQNIFFDEWQVPLIGEAFQLYTARASLYRTTT